MKLAPDSIDAQYALAFWQRDVDRAAAEQGFRRILERQPDHTGALFGLSNIAFRTHRIKESQEYLGQVAKNPQWAPLAGYLQFLGYFTVAQFEDADRVLRHSIALKPSANTLGGLGMLLLTWKGDPRRGGAGAHLEPGGAQRDAHRVDDRRGAALPAAPG